MSISETVRSKKQRLIAIKRKMRPGGLDNLDHAQRIDITYTSNALEGNTLTAGETALVIEKGITIGGKPLRDHLEAIDHARALDWIIEDVSRDSAPLSEVGVRNLHRLVVAQSQPEIAGRYADRARYANTNTGVHHFPSPAEIPALMGDFSRWLGNAPSEPENAFEAHRRLVNIYPFNDGNGRTARLLMNLMLLRGGYPPIAIRPEDRPDYVAALEAGQAGGSYDAFDALLFGRLDETLDRYLVAASEAS